jgi:hypothetical protein
MYKNFRSGTNWRLKKPIQVIFLLEIRY